MGSIEYEGVSRFKIWGRGLVLDFRVQDYQSPGVPDPLATKHGQSHMDFVSRSIRAITGKLLSLKRLLYTYMLAQSPGPLMYSPNRKSNLAGKDHKQPGPSPEPTPLPKFCPKTERKILKSEQSSSSSSSGS